MDLFITCFTLFAAFFAIKIINLIYFDKSKIGKPIPGPKAWPLIGNALDFLKLDLPGVLETLRSYPKKYGGIVRIDFGMKVWIYLTDPKYIETILSSDKFLDKSDDYDLVLDWLGTGLVSSSGQKWTIHRRALTPAFHFSVLEKFIPIMHKNGEILIDKINRSNKDNENNSFRVFELLKLYTLDIICETSMGCEINAQAGDSKYAQVVDVLSETIFFRAFHPIAWNNWFFKFFSRYKEYKEGIDYVHAFAHNIIQKRKKELKNEPVIEQPGIDEDNIYFSRSKKLSFLDILLKTEINGAHFTDEEIREEVDTFMFAGHDTTTTTLTFLFYQLAKNQDIQAKVFAEIDQVFDHNKSPVIESTKELNRLPYLDLVIKETLRMFPAVVTIARKLKADLELDGYILKKGENVAIGILSMHYDEKYYPEPEKFYPERFDRDVGPTKVHPFAHIPFSAGYRNCIGQKFALNEMKMTVVKILSNFQLYLKDENYKLVLTPQGVLKAVDPIELIFKER